MRTSLTLLVLSLSLVALSGSSTAAQHTKGLGPTKGVGHVSHGNGNGYGHAETGTSVPEFDPAAAGAPLALLVGGVALMFARRRQANRVES